MLQMQQRQKIILQTAAPKEGNHVHPQETLQMYSVLSGLLCSAAMKSLSCYD